MPLLKHPWLYGFALMGVLLFFCLRSLYYDNVIFPNPHRLGTIPDSISKHDYVFNLYYGRYRPVPASGGELPSFIAGGPEPMPGGGRTVREKIKLHDQRIMSGGRLALEHSPLLFGPHIGDQTTINAIHDFDDVQSPFGLSLNLLRTGPDHGQILSANLEFPHPLSPGHSGGNHVSEPYTAVLLVSSNRSDLPAYVFQTQMRLSPLGIPELAGPLVQVTPPKRVSQPVTIRDAHNHPVATLILRYQSESEPSYLVVTEDQEHAIEVQTVRDFEGGSAQPRMVTSYTHIESGQEPLMTGYSRRFPMPKGLIDYLGNQLARPEGYWAPKERHPNQPAVAGELSEWVGHLSPQPESAYVDSRPIRIPLRSLPFQPLVDFCNQARL